MKVRQTAPPPAPKPTYTRYDRAEKTFHYTQDGFTRDVSLHDANTRGILAFAGTSAVTVPLSLAFGSAMFDKQEWHCLRSLGYRFLK